MSDFWSEPSQVITRKTHRCVSCGGAIAKGDKSIIHGGRYCGRFWKSRHHPECSLAENTLNRELSGLPLSCEPPDDWSSLASIIASYPRFLRREDMHAIRSRFPLQWIKMSFPGLFSLMPPVEPVKDLEIA